MYAFKKQHVNAITPTRGTPGSAGYDLSSTEEKIVPAHCKAIVDTGIAISIPHTNVYARVAPRSGLAAKHCIDVLAGVIDSDYRDAIKVILFNHSYNDYKINVGDRIAQLIFEKVETPDLIELQDGEELDATQRGTGGFGSTGI